MSPYQKAKVPGRHIDQHRHLMEQRVGRRLRRDEVVHHRNDNKRDNRIENLEPMSLGAHSSMHNSKHPKTKPCVVCSATFTPAPTKRERAKTCSRICFSQLMAERAHLTQLDAAKVRRIRERHAGGERVSALARELGLHRDTIGLIVRRRTWRHVT